MAILVFFGLFGGVGFDHPGSYGLDVDQMILVCIFYGLSVVIGVAMAIKTKSYKFLMFQVSIPPFLFVAAIVTSMFSSAPLASSSGLPPRAEYFQHLVGESEVEVMAELQHFGIGLSGAGGSSEWDSFEQYGPIEVRYSKEGKVVSIADIE
ncbi:MAG: hypothetical protein KDA91_12240 [Planctomycetaceae bacterium]|nr:hypothetical protein [Planctomycetaceae bacterium]